MSVALPLDKMSLADKLAAMETLWKTSAATPEISLSPTGITKS